MSLFKKIASTAMISALMSVCAQSQASNVILIIGDGMDEQQITAARNYLYGAQGHSILSTLPIRSAVQVLTVDEHDPNLVKYVADSANSATAMASGGITSRGRIGTSAGENVDFKTIIELAQEAGLKTGLVSTASITDATPASFIAHVNNRGCESAKHMVAYEDHGDRIIDCRDDTKQQGGKGSISEQLADSQVDVLLGGGYKHFKRHNEANTQTLLVQAQANGFEFIDSLSQSDATNNDKKLLGIFAKGHLPVRLQGTDGRIAEKSSYSFLNFFNRYLGSVTLPDVMTCESNPEFVKKNTPNLKDLTHLALQRLQNDKGFFLMVESASIDKQSHKRNPCGSIGEAQQLFESVQVALNFAKQHKDTLVMITADHGQAAQIVPNGSLFDAYGVPVASPGYVARIKTPEGGVMSINYATNDFSYEEHTGVNVPLFANQQVMDSRGEKMIIPLIKQTDIFDISKTFLGL
jgi:alkaline phosphatase